MAALGEQVELVAPPLDRPADQLLAAEVALGGVDDVQPGVERLAEQAGDGLGLGPLEADLGAAEAEHADPHVRPAELPHLHGPSSVAGCVPTGILSQCLPGGHPAVPRTGPVGLSAGKPALADGVMRFGT